MQATPSVRQMRDADLPRVRDLALQLGYDSDPDELRARFARILERPEQALLVAVRGDHVAGWLHAQSQHTLESGSYVEITGLVIAAEDRRRGVGRALVERARAWAHDLGYATLRVRSNVQAHRSALVLSCPRLPADEDPALLQARRMM